MLISADLPEFSLRTKLLLASYLVSLGVGTAYLIALAAILAASAMGRAVPVEIAFWPWFPSSVVVILVAKILMRWSFRNDARNS